MRWIFRIVHVIVVPQDKQEGLSTLNISPAIFSIPSSLFFPDSNLPWLKNNKISFKMSRLRVANAFMIWLFIPDVDISLGK